uniref:Nudix hydrolase 3 n=1 Tax=Schistocephalus solidus TaxID=70667 RepID=A0A0X3NKU5_SCHSO
MLSTFLSPYTKIRMSKFGQIFGSSNRQRCVSLLKKVTPLRPKPEICHDSAVLIPLIYYDGRPAILYTKRSMCLRLHPGEVSFPGGKIDANMNEEAVSTALRELYEEVGIPKKFVDIWTTFCPCPTASTSSFINPVVGFCGYYNSQTGTLSVRPDGDHHHHDSDGGAVKLTVNEAEVDSLIFRSIDWLCDKRNFHYALFCEHRAVPFTGISSLRSRPYKVRPRPSPHSMRFAMPVFGGPPGKSDWPRIWGLTGLMTYQLLTCLLPDGMHPHPLLPGVFDRHF